MAKSFDKELNGKGDKRGLHPNSLRNLDRGRKTWTKGKSGNPSGRPAKDVSLTSLLKEELNKIPEGETRTWRQQLVEAWLKGALKNPLLFFELLNRIEGKVTQPISGEGGGPIKIDHNVLIRKLETLAGVKNGQ